jgi:hypothetical protein
MPSSGLPAIRVMSEKGALQPPLVWNYAFKASLALLIIIIMNQSPFDRVDGRAARGWGV